MRVRGGQQECDGGGRQVRVYNAGRDAAGTVPINLNFVVRNFGPVEHCDIDIKPLTVLIGPNNSGKSYVATLLQSILTAQSQVTGPRFRTYGAVTSCSNILQKKSERDKHKILITRSESKKILDIVLDEEMGPELERQIARNFGSKVQDLIRMRKNRSSVEVAEPSSKSGEISKLIIKIGDKMSVKSTAKPASYVVEVKQQNESYSISINDRHGHANSADGGAENSVGMWPVMHTPLPGEGEDLDQVYRLSAMGVIEKISNQFRFKSTLKKLYHFPAARSGILQGHKALTASIVEHAPYVGIGPNEIPQVTGVVRDFISQIIMMEDVNGPFAAIANDMENELLGGNIELNTSVTSKHPEITYRYNGSTMPLHRGSSTVSEIAPLLLYLKHIVRKNSFLIIEEPEAHLHPANQLVLAKYIVRLIRSGVNILITTHSVFLLEKLAKYMMAGNLTPKQRSADLGYGRDDFLTQDEVSAYLFERQPSGGHRTKPVDRDEEYGISQEEFVRVSEALHNETIIINSKMGTLGNA